MQSKTSQEIIEDIVLNGSKEQKKFLFSFSKDNTIQEIYKKFQLFTKSNYIRYFKEKDAPFHKEMAINYIKSYLGENYINLAFRGSSKTSLVKLFIVFVILNDIDKSKKYIKINSKDIKNSKQIVTDVYNMCLEVMYIYGNVFEKEGDKKREERMDSFTMKSGIKVMAGSVGQTQRGHIQDAYRPDWIIFEDCEDRDSISSKVITEGIIAQCDEAITGLAKNGSYSVNGNYISENGVMQWFLDKKNIIKQITPILGIDGKPAWDIYTLQDIQKLKDDVEDFYGEYMQDPARADNKFFDIDRIDKDLKLCKEPAFIKDNIKYWNHYIQHHRYGIGADTSEGVGRDSCASVLWNFTTGELVSSYHSNIIKPELFAYELKKVGEEYGNCVIAPEINNMSGGIVIITLKAIYKNIFRQIDKTKLVETETLKLGWHTNSRSKPTMFMDFRRDYNDGLIKIYDKEILQEMRSFNQSDITEQKSKITKHYDLLTASVIAWQMRNYLESNIQEAIVQYH